MGKFSEYQKVNAQIDVWIDEEESRQVYAQDGGQVGILELSNLELVDGLFTESDTCTHGKDGAWREVLSQKFPVKKAGKEELNVKVSLDRYWSHLFFAKLLRARIMERGTDCYYRRLDDIVSYLERNLPNYSKSDRRYAKLAVLYLLELSASALSYEIIGFAERARRILKEYLNNDQVFYWFYSLLARYNIGVALFHKSNYQESVLEFNYVIYEIQSTREKAKLKGQKEAKRRIRFFHDHHGEKFLYLPSINYRADIQLELQLAYHALNTLNAYPELNQDKDQTKNRDYKRIKADLIRIEAYQFMGQLDKSSEKLRELWRVLFDTLPEQNVFPSEDEVHPKAFQVVINPGDYLQNVKGRLLGLAMAQHLEYLKRQKQHLSNQVKNTGNKLKQSKLLKWIKRNKVYLQELGAKSFRSYFKAVEYEDPDRQGFWEQVAEYLGWLSDIVDDKAIKSDSNILKSISEIASFFTDEANGTKLCECLRQLPPEESQDETKSDNEKELPNKEFEKHDFSCSWCEFKGIKLARLKSDSYDEFRDRMLKLLDKQNDLKLNISNKGHDGSENGEHYRETLIRRLIKLEEEQRNDLRIYDLELRYKLIKSQPSLIPEARDGRQFCWKGVADDKIAGFELLPCSDDRRTKLLCQPSTEDACPFRKNSLGLINNDLLSREHYERVLEQWDEDFLRHLKSPSKHEQQEPGLYFLGLRRWNSASPAKGYSVGGGYLIYQLDNHGEVNLGIAIDPGFDFVRNLFHMGFSLNDIDIVLVSHAHIDHIRDLESIVTLLFELSKRGNRLRKVHIILSLAVYKKLGSIIENPGLRLHVEPYIIDINREIETDYFERLGGENNSSCFTFRHTNDSVNRLQPLIERDDTFAVRIQPTRAYHDDKSGYSDSFGFLIDFRLSDDKGKKSIAIGYSGDTKWVYPLVNDPLGREGRKIEDNIKQYDICKALIVHLGSLIQKDKETGNYRFTDYNCLNGLSRCEDLVQKEGHPYLVGLLRILSSIYEKRNTCEKDFLVLVGEFGEEMRGKIRVDLIRRLRSVYGDKILLLPVDVGINVQLWVTRKRSAENSSSQMRVWCVQCNRFVPIQQAEFEHYGMDEAIYCVCKTCKTGTPSDVLQRRLGQIYEVGYELRTARNET